MEYLDDIVSFMYEELKIEEFFDDTSNNGLQIEGKREINKIAFAVDINKRVIEKAISIKADMIFVHHGLSWKDSLKYLTGYNFELVAPIIKNGISLFGAHLPLDAHNEIGHNAMLANAINLFNSNPFASFRTHHIGIFGDIETVDAKSLGEKLYNDLRSIRKSYAACRMEQGDIEERVLIVNKEKMVRTVGIVSGGGGMCSLMEAIDLNLDALITGELTHSMYNLAKDQDMAVIAAGHYNTETPGIIATMEILKEQFKIEGVFLDISTGL